jgi:hypothetical protein
MRAHNVLCNSYNSVTVGDTSNTFLSKLSKFTCSYLTCFFLLLYGFPGKCWTSKDYNIHLLTTHNERGSLYYNVFCTFTWCALYLIGMPFHKLNVMIKINLHYIFYLYRLIPHLIKNTWYIHYKDQSLNVAQGDNRCYKHTLSGQNVFLMLNLEISRPIGLTGFILLMMMMMMTCTADELQQNANSAFWRLCTTHEDRS